jgi:hypothetical protein
MLSDPYRSEPDVSTVASDKRTSPRSAIAQVSSQADGEGGGV